MKESNTVKERAAFHFVRYANVWEDADILCEALRPVARGGRILSIASAGDNALGLLTLDPSEVVAADISSAQVACLELRMAAFRSLNNASVLSFLGLHPCEDRLAIYRSIKHTMRAPSVAFWDARPDAVQKGIIHCGKFERYLRLFGKWILPMIHSKAVREGLLQPKTFDEQKMFYHRTWNTKLWRSCFQLFFSRAIMQRLGRASAFFDHVEGSVADHILAKTEAALTELSTQSNPYLTYIMTGNYRTEALPLYLREENMSLIRERLDRITLVQADVGEGCSGQFDGFNLSDIFEYMSPTEHRSCYEKLLAHAAPHARLAYWNMLVPRSCPTNLQGNVRRLDEESRRLLSQQKAWFYQDFHVDEVRG